MAWHCQNIIGLFNCAIQVFNSLPNTESTGGCFDDLHEMQSQLQYVYPHCVIDGEVKFSCVQSQVQTNSDDCGLFAIATATALAHHIDPTVVLFDERQMRSHLVACYEGGRLTPFPLRDQFVGGKDIGGSTNEPESARPKCLINNVGDSTSSLAPSSEPPVASYPSIWSQKQAIEFKSDHTWLFFADGCLGCKICREVKNLGAFQKHGIHLSQQWCNGSIAYNGTTRQNQLSSLRKKIFEHEKGNPHITAVDICRKASEGAMENVLSEQQKHLYDSTSRIFRSVYSCMKNNRPFSDLPQLVNLQTLNGLDMGHILHSRKSASAISDFIAVKMRKKLCSEIINSGAKIALILDESTTASGLSVLIIYLRSIVRGKVSSFFLDLVELSGSDSKSIITALTSTLCDHGFDKNYLSSNLIGVCSDGASVMVGKQSGVLTELATMYPNIIMWHCLCHRIELSVGDTMKDVAGTSHFKIFMEKLYSVYSMSPKNQREVKAAARELDLQFRKIGKMLTIRWVASSFRAVSAVHQNYAALHNHFSAAAIDKSRDDKMKASFRGLASALSSEEFVLSAYTWIHCQNLQKYLKLCKGMMSLCPELTKSLAEP